MAKTGRANGAARDVPSGIEILVAKAAADRRFRRLLLRRRSLAANALDLDLSPAEAAMLKAVPTRQLEAMIDGAAYALSRETSKKRKGKLKSAAVFLLAAAGAGSLKFGCQQPQPPATRPWVVSRPPPSMPMMIVGIMLSPPDWGHQPAAQQVPDPGLKGTQMPLKSLDARPEPFGGDGDR